MELNREQIIKAMECCGTEHKCCSSCPLARDYSPCSKTMANNALSIIKELTEENEDLYASCAEAAKRLSDLEIIAEYYQAEASRLAEIVNGGEEKCKAMYPKR